VTGQRIQRVSCYNQRQVQTAVSGSVVDQQKIDIKNIPVYVEVHTPSANKAPEYAPRNRIYVRAVKGLHQAVRRYMGFVFMGLFMLLPWLQYEGHQAILLDITE